MKARFVTLIAAAMLGGCGLLGSGTEKQLAKAEAGLQSGNYAEAAITLFNVVADEPGNAAAQLLLARAQYMRGDLAGADSALRAAGEAGADPAVVAEMRAKLAIGRGEFAELLQGLESGQYAMSDRAAQLYRARADQGLGKPVEALAIYDALLASAQVPVDLHVYAAECQATLGRVELAMRYIEGALTLEPELSSAWRLRAALLASDTEGAQGALQKAIEFAPGQLTIPEQLGLLAPEFQRAVNRLDVNAAGRLQQKMLSLASELPLAQWASAELQLIRGDATEASATLQRLVQRAPDFAPARPALIGALLAAGNLELAIQESTVLVGNAPGDQRLQSVKQAIKLAADADEGTEQQIMQSVAAALILEQTPAARWMLEQGLAAQPDSESLAVLAIQQQQAAGEVDQALERARKLVARLPQSQGARTLLAVLQAASGDQLAAQQIYEALWREAPGRSIALSLAQSRMRTRQGDPLEPLRQWLASHPDDLRVRTGMASAALELGLQEVATKEYERVIAVAPANALALNNLAWLYSQRGDKRALATARRAYEAAGTPDIADTYGWLLARTGDDTAALPLLERAARGAPGNPVVRYHFAAVLARSSAPGDRAKARLWLADLLSVPSNTEWRSSAEKLLGQLTAP
jgi:tetratricopeptide (TPR) repeat protein